MNKLSKAMISLGVLGAGVLAYSMMGNSKKKKARDFIENMTKPISSNK